MFEIHDEDINQVEEELGLYFDEPRREAIKNYLDIQACPGSGKTTMVAAKLLILAKKWTVKYQGICVLTHTNVAKDEIIERLKHSPEGLKLLHYPHFIGTIQEFVNKFLAIPCLRSNGYSVSQIDDELTSEKAWRMLDFKTRQFLTKRGIQDLKTLQYQWENEMVLNVTGFVKESKSHSYTKLATIKDKLLNSGYFFYEEMYSFANFYLNESPSLILSIQQRFPIVFVDEMQDTHNHQDELLNQLFDNQNVCFQRFGDPDQAIYSGTGSGEENSYNSHAEIVRIENSHRFTPSIANLAKRLSANQINLCSALQAPEEMVNTIFLVDDNSRNLVVNHFAELCYGHVDRESSLPIKAIGAVGKHGSDGLDLTGYHRDFSKNKSRKAFKPDTLIQYFYRAHQAKEFSHGYALIIDGIVRAANLAGAKLPDADYYTSSNLKRFLKDSNNQKRFNRQILEILNPPLSEERWRHEIETLLKMVHVENFDTATVSNYLEFKEETLEQVEASAEHKKSGNKLEIAFEEGGGIEIEFETIHGVKGETHAATLVLETKFYKNDISEMIGYILGSETTPPTTIRKKKFMKQLYVAFSRPKHLLCIAMDRAGFPEAHIGKESHAGWNIVDLTNN